MQAYAEYQAIRRLPAFNVVGAKPCRINQFLTNYLFEDGSTLQIFARHSYAKVIAPNGMCVVVGDIRVNR